jgi:hypothetical protein
MRGALAAMLVRSEVRGGEETGPSGQEGGEKSLLYSVTFVISMDTHCYGSATRKRIWRHMPAACQPSPWQHE